MERTATQCITYGLYMLSTVWEKKANGCIIDTCMQISHEPVQIAIAVSNQSYTCELLKKSGIFAVSILVRHAPSRQSSILDISLEEMLIK